jgi:hypothetical protein
VLIIWRILPHQERWTIAESHGSRVAQQVRRGLPNLLGYSRPSLRDFARVILLSETATPIATNRDRRSGNVRVVESGDSDWVVKDLSLEIQPGETITVFPT